MRFPSAYQKNTTTSVGELISELKPETVVSLSAPVIEIDWSSCPLHQPFKNAKKRVARKPRVKRKTHKKRARRTRVPRRCRS